MWDSTMTVMMLEGIRDTVYMTVVSTLFGYILGLPLGIALTLTDKNGLRQNRTIYRTLDVIINITMYIPAESVLLIATQKSCKGLGS